MVNSRECLQCGTFLVGDATICYRCNHYNMHLDGELIAQIGSDKVKTFTNKCLICKVPCNRLYCCENCEHVAVAEAREKKPEVIEAASDLSPELNRMLEAASKYRDGEAKLNPSLTVREADLKMLRFIKGWIVGKIELLKA